jgi:hypothetical protein
LPTPSRTDPLPRFPFEAAAALEPPAEGIYAAGDVARWHHEGLDALLRLENRTNATGQAVAVAGNILGEDRPCTRPCPASGPTGSTLGSTCTERCSRTAKCP